MNQNFNRQRLMRFIFSIIILITLIHLSSCKETVSQQEINQVTINTEEKAKKALEFIKQNKMNTDFCFLLDFSKHSGYKRFFVWNFNSNEITHEFLVSHGAGSNTWSGTETMDNPDFSNTDGSHLSSLGKYKIGERGWSNWGINIKYLMHGLEPSNSNALKRVVVLHGWEAISDQETYPKGTPEGWGCPAVSNQTMIVLDEMLKTAEKPVLLWIYN